MKIGALIVCLTVGMAAVAQQTSSPYEGAPPTVTEVMNFYQVMHVREQFQSMLSSQQSQIKIMANDMFSKSLPDASDRQKKEMADLLDGMMNDIFKNYPIEDILRDMVPVYQKHLTESDLNAVIAFYSSPAGQKLLHEMPSMTTEGMWVSYTRLQPKLDEMMKNLQQRIQKMKEEDANEAPAPKQ